MSIHGGNWQQQILVYLETEISGEPIIFNKQRKITFQFPIEEFK